MEKIQEIKFKIELISQQILNVIALQAGFFVPGYSSEQMNEVSAHKEDWK